ncbi:MAG: hypothetical protein HQM09_22545 [Candidatus Riflebacteria bacterium]|nr:hypothetical protein [Candidatus Riflebacteria bacterium]
MNSDYEIIFSPALCGSVTVQDVLTTSGTMAWAIHGADLAKNVCWFCVISPKYVFEVGTKDRSLIIHRGNTVSELVLEDFMLDEKVVLWALWTPSELKLIAKNKNRHKEAVVPTSPCIPPPDLVRWARKQLFLPVSEFGDEEEMRTAIHAAILSIEHKLQSTQAWHNMWDSSPKGTGEGRKPKRETEVQPLLHCAIHDQMFVKGIEIIPERTTGVGRIDFELIGTCKGRGNVNYAVECKLAHSRDLEHGVVTQLPEYMTAINAQYGAYIVIDFRDDNFKFPVLDENQDLDSLLDCFQMKNRSPFGDRIRNFVIRVGKRASASKL